MVGFLWTKSRSLSYGPPNHQVTSLLHAWTGGDEGALDRLLSVVYGDLHRLGAAVYGAGTAGPHAATHGAGQ